MITHTTRKPYFPPYAGLHLSEQMAERNVQGLTQWRLKVALREVYPDAVAPIVRTLLNRWLGEQLELARRWMFKERAKKRGMLRQTNWAALARVYRS